MRAGTFMTPMAAALLLGACGSSGGGGAACTPESSAAIAIRAGGVTPMAVCVLPGGSVTFTNEDAAPHDIASGGACPQLDLGVIPASESRTTAAFPTVATCQFRDDLDPTNPAFQGLVAVTNAPVTGPGY